MTRSLAGALLAVEEPYEAGPTALFVIVLLAIGIFFLARSMLKHLKRVPASFDPPDAQSTDPSGPEPAPDGDRNDLPRP
ncbi:MAG: hypothetical protein H0V10_00415 [Geodermatophilaceae bacterium]|nr:hypothetical protein [Geodermatophilaceae bacterium]